jgi:hypothetical protein
LASDQGDWYFQVFLDDKPIGYHHFTLNDNRLQSTAEFNVKILFINAYHYKHNNRELWDGNCLAEIHSETIDNGEQYSVNGATVNNHFRVSTQDSKTTLTGCVRTFAYWDPELLDTPYLLNTQTGEYQEVNLEQAGNEEFSLYGKTVQASRYVLKTDDGDIELWYGPEGEWIALNSTTKGGRILRYVRRFSDELTKSNKQADNRSML